MKKIYLLFSMMIFFSAASAQEEGEPFAELSLGAGIGNEGLSYGGSVDLTMFNIITGLRATINGGAAGFSPNEVKELGLFAGYGHNKEHYSFSFAGGYSMSHYRCISDCIDYKKGIYWGPTAQVRAGIRFGRSGLGLLGFGNFNRHGDLYAALLVFTLGI